GPASRRPNPRRQTEQSPPDVLHPPERELPALGPAVPRAVGLPVVAGAVAALAPVGAYGNRAPRPGHKLNRNSAFRPGIAGRRPGGGTPRAGRRRSTIR